MVCSIFQQSNINIFPIYDYESALMALSSFCPSQFWSTSHATSCPSIPASGQRCAKAPGKSWHPGGQGKGGHGPSNLGWVGKLEALGILDQLSESSLPPRQEDGSLAVNRKACEAHPSTEIPFCVLAPHHSLSVALELLDDELRTIGKHERSQTNLMVIVTCFFDVIS